MLIIILGLCGFTAAAPWTVQNAANTFQNYYYGDEYAQNYQHEDHDYPSTFMERKVDQIVSNGSAYLEGLRRSLNAYAEKLRNCTDLDFNNTTDDSFLACRRLTKDGEKARRLAQLALWTTRKIQESSTKLSEPEERTLLMRLAWLLEKLAKVTGYQPRPEDYLNVTEAPRTPNVTAMPLILDVAFNVSDDVIHEMVDCLDPHANSSVPAYVRCPRAPLPTVLLNILSGAAQQSITEPAVNATSTTNTSTSDLEPASSDLQPNVVYTPYIPTYISPEKVYITGNYDTNPHKPNLPYHEPRNRKIYAHRNMPEDPQQDISAYSKFKEGTSIVNNPQQVVEARLALERHFSIPNIEVVRRYGSNYNPLIPDVNNAGLIRTILDV